MLALAGGWAITEWLRATMFTGFAWNPIGVTLADTPLLGASRLIGTYGLSALAVADCAAACWIGRPPRSGAAVRSASPPAMLRPALAVAAAHPNAVARRRNWRRRPHRPIRIVQPNIGQQDKWRPGFEEKPTGGWNGCRSRAAPSSA